MNDELGSRISHSRAPNFRLVPLFYVPRQISYSVLFPVEDVELGDVVTRNYIEGPVSDEVTVRALLLPWYNFDFSTEDIDWHQTEPDAQFFHGGRHVETLPHSNGYAIDEGEF